MLSRRATPPRMWAFWLMATFTTSHCNRAIESFPSNDWDQCHHCCQMIKHWTQFSPASLGYLTNTRSKLKVFSVLLASSQSLLQITLHTEATAVFAAPNILTRSWSDLTQSSGRMLYSNATNLFKLVLHLAPLHSVWDCVTPLAGNIVLVESASPGYPVLTYCQTMSTLSFGLHSKGYHCFVTSKCIVILICISSMSSSFLSFILVIGQHTLPLGHLYFCLGVFAAWV